MPGRYVLRYPHGTEVLSLRADGTFDQEYTSNSNAQRLKHSGKWRLGNGQDTELILDRAMIINEWPKNTILLPPQYSVVTLSVRVVAGIIELVVDSDGDLYYQQTMPNTR